MLGCTTTKLTGVLLMVLSLPATAASLQAPASLSLEAGEHLQQTLSVVDLQGMRIQIALGKAPPGVRLTVDGYGQVRLDWHAGPDLAVETLVEILLSNVDSGELLERREFMIRRVEPAPVPSTPAEPESALATPSDAVPVLTELANQVISAGLTVKIQVEATLPDALTPVLQVDRLPRRASFEAGKGGGRTFYWQTDNQDEGVHIFRFSAINPADATLRTSREVMIVIGDPTKNMTRPEPEGAARQQ